MLTRIMIARNYKDADMIDIYTDTEISEFGNPPTSVWGVVHIDLFSDLPEIYKHLNSSSEPLEVEIKIKQGT